MFTTADPAIRKLLDKVGWKRRRTVDLFEINEAFAVVAMAAHARSRHCQRPSYINGGACALGHPIGATGARLYRDAAACAGAQNLKRASPHSASAAVKHAIAIERIDR